MEALHNVVDGCVACNICSRECSFLQKHGTPGQICHHYLLGENMGESPVFECNLCGLCQQVCPQKLDCTTAFLHIRKDIQKTANAASEIQSVHNRHKQLCTYEARGSSPLFSLHLFPAGCRSVFFPGCTLAATRSAITRSVYEHLKTVEQNCGIILDCCGKPSHDLGLSDKFDLSFTELSTLLTHNNIKRVITACPSCYSTFTTYAPSIETVSVYEILADHFPEKIGDFEEVVSIHDTCTTRHVSQIHDSVRALITGTGAVVEEVKHSRSQAICCGEGAAASFIAPEITDGWKVLRKDESSQGRVITYCAGCSSALAKKLHTTHLLDLLFDQDRAVKGKEKITRSPYTYVNRLRLKNQLKRSDRTASLSSRSALTKKGTQSSQALKIILLLALCGALVLPVFSASDYFDTAHLQQFLLKLQGCPPLLYIAAFALAPVVFLPASPFVMAGGLLYGPFWGILYAMSGATLGAAFSFLVSRYVSSDFIAAKLTGPRWRQLQTNVEKHGWQVVAVTRLIPLFPYNLLNYALGMTRIKFSHYLIATFFCMLPSCIAFVVFSSSLTDLLKGHISRDFMLGLLGVLLLSALPVFSQKFVSKR